MKKTLAALALSLALFACKKDNVNNFRSEVAGTWELEMVSGWPFGSVPYPPGNANILVLGKDGSYERKLRDSVEFKGTYNIQKKEDCRPNVTDFQFTTSESPTDRQYVELTENKLKIHSSTCVMDGGTVTYRRIN